MEKRIIDIIDMDLSGRGIGRDNGKAVFVPGAITGDRVECVTEIQKKRYDVARLAGIVCPSDKRIIPECDRFGECGGCAFMNLNRDAELDIKRRAVESAFRRAGVRDVKVDSIFSGSDRAYRNKAVFHLGCDGTCGFFSSGSKDCRGGVDCLLVPDVFNEIVRFAESVKTDDPIPESIMLRSNGADVMIAAEVSAFGNGVGVLEAITDRFPQVVSAYECVGYPTAYDSEFRLYKGDAYIDTEFCGGTFRLSPKSFFQVNTEIAEQFCRRIAESLSPKDGDTILDLYCGIGTIGLTVARHFPSARIIGVEINESAVADAKHNAGASGIGNAEFICADAGKVRFDARPYAVIVDPPRYGLTDSMIETILRLKPEIIVYMSCDPGTLAGNASKLTSGGYSIRSCVAGDMFPECPHVESLCIFERK